MVLTSKQSLDLHLSLYTYFTEHGMIACAAALVTETKIDPSTVDLTPFSSLLEKKWTAVVKLQKKVMELEQLVEQAKEEVKASQSGGRKAVDVKEMLPNRVKHVLNGHRETVNVVRFHPVFNLVASASDDASIKIWDFESGTFERTLKAHTEAVEDLDFNKTGTLMVSASSDLTVKVWDLAEYVCVRTLYGHDHTVSSVSFCPTGEFIISASRDKSVKVWETSSGFCVRTLEGHEQWVRQLAISGDVLATASSDQTVRIWTWKTGACLYTLREHDHVVEAVKFSNAAADSIIPLLQESKTNFITPKESKENLTAKDKQGGLFLATGSRDKMIKVWSVDTGVCLFTFSGHDNWVRALLFHPSGKYLLSCSDDKSIRAWDLSKGKQARKLDYAHDNFITSLDWSQTYPALASSSVDSSIRIWDLK